MGQSWAETSMYLNSLRLEYLIICEELKATSDLEHRKQLHQWATTCLQEFHNVLDQYRRHHIDRYSTSQHTDQ